VSEATVVRSRPLIGRLPWIVVLVLAVGLVAAGQLAEDAADSPPLQLLSPELAIRRWTVILAVLYLVVTSRFVDRLVDRAVAAFDRVFETPPAGLEIDVAGLRRPSLALDTGLFLASLAVVWLIFGVAGTSLPTDDPVTGQATYLPAMGPSAIAIVLEYAVVGWALLSLITCTIRRAWSLRRLAHGRLAIDVFDTTNLLPLGNIALGTSLAPAGIIVILLIGYGRPSQPLSWGILALATLASMLALLLPLRGIHRQMAHAKHDAQSRMGVELRAIYDEVGHARRMGHGSDPALIARLGTHTGLIIPLRKAVDEMTTWPFRDTLAFGRAVLIASAPLIYTVISELIKAIWINPLT
jgi:hypothetical protein